MFSSPCKLQDHLYIGSISSVNKSNIKLCKIKAIVSCLSNEMNIKSLNVDELHINIDDFSTAQISDYFDEVGDFIHKHNIKKENTLVHCMAGVSRSATLCIAYLMKYNGMTLKEAYDYAFSKRTLIRPNPGFFKQLIEYEKKLFSKNTVYMVESEMGPIPDVYLDSIKDMIPLETRSRSKLSNSIISTNEDIKS